MSSLLRLERKRKDIYDPFRMDLFIAEMISFVLFPQASQPRMNFNISELLYSHLTLSFLFIRIWSDKYIHELLFSLQTYTRIQTKLN